MEATINIPDYLSIKDWKYFNSLDHLNDTEKMVSLISKMGQVDTNDIRKWKPTELTDVYKTLLESFQDLEPQFYPVIELDGIKYGYTPMTKMTLGEYMDLERLASKSHDNIEEIMAILYRPITKHRFSGIKWAFKSSHKIALGEAENLFKYYDVEEYDSSKREENALKLANIPASIGLGCMSFFLLVGSSSLVGSQISSLNPKEGMKQMKELNKQMGSVNIGAGLLQFITYLQHPSFQSQDRKQSQSSISSLYLTSWPLNKIKTIGMNRLESNKKDNIE
tara:strand:+ start:272 stop:1108 length:837 start_codon:yes stop_codon:yes gene_type:complete